MVAQHYAVQKGRLDEVYLRQWGQEIGVLSLVETALSGKLRLKQT